MANLKFNGNVKHEIEVGDVVTNNNDLCRLIIFDSRTNEYLSMCLESFEIVWSGDTLDEVNQMYGNSSMRIIKNNKIVITEE